MDNDLDRHLEVLKATPFPAHAEDDKLDDLLLELAELDGFIAGLIETRLSGSRVDSATANHAIMEFEERYGSYPVALACEDDQEVYRIGQRYLQLLKRIAACMQ